MKVLLHLKWTPNDKGDECQISACTAATPVCMYSGTCSISDDGSEIICDCLEGFSGKNCEDTPCVNGKLKSIVFNFHFDLL